MGEVGAVEPVLHQFTHTTVKILRHDQPAGIFTPQIAFQASGTAEVCMPT